MQEQVYVLHLITCHGRIMPRLAELLLQVSTGISIQSLSKEIHMSVVKTARGVSWIIS